MADWKKVDLTQFPFYFTEDHPEVDKFHKGVQKELGGKNLEYFWGEESENEPDYLENFECRGWESVFRYNGHRDDPTESCYNFGVVSMIKGSPLKGVGWAIIFEMNCPIWIREKGDKRLLVR